MEKLFVYLPVGCRGFYFNEKRNYSWVHVIIYYISCCESTFFCGQIDFESRKRLENDAAVGENIYDNILCSSCGYMGKYQGIARKWE